MNMIHLNWSGERTLILTINACKSSSQSSHKPGLCGQHPIQCYSRHQDIYSQIPKLGRR